MRYITLAALLACAILASGCMMPNPKKQAAENEVKLNSEGVFAPVPHGVATKADATGQALVDERVTRRSAGFSELGIAIGDTVINRSDGSSGAVTQVNSDSIVCSGGLSGGKKNAWNDGDVWLKGHVPAPLFSAKGTGGVTLTLAAADTGIPRPADEPEDTPADNQPEPAVGGEDSIPADSPPALPGDTAEPGEDGDAAPARAAPQAPPPVMESRLVLFFIPAIDTPNTTKNLRKLAKFSAELSVNGITTAAVCPAGLDSLEAYAKRYGIGLTLLADPDMSIARAYGCAGEDSKYAQRTFAGIDLEGEFAFYQRGFPYMNAKMLLEDFGIVQ